MMDYLVVRGKQIKNVMLTKYAGNDDDDDVVLNMVETRMLHSVKNIYTLYIICIMRICMFVCFVRKACTVLAYSLIE